MKILQEAQKNFISMGFDPNLKPFNRRILNTLFITSLAIVSELIFIIYESDSAQEYMDSIYVLTTCAGSYLSFASTIFMKMKLFSFIKSFDVFFNELTETPKAKAICEKTNELVEKYSKIGNFFMKYVAIALYMCPKVVISIFTYFTTDLGNGAFDLPFLMWFPFDWKNPIWYLMAAFIQFILTTCLFQLFRCFIILALGVFMFFTAYVQILKNKLCTINKMTRRKSLHKKMYKKLSESIRIHSNAKQLVLSFSDFYEITLTLAFVTSLITICCGMLLAQIEISYNQTDSTVLLEATYIATSLILLLFICELGQRLTNVIDEIYDVTIRCNWYLFPREILRVLPTVMQSAQQPSVIKCFGNISCAREQLKKVIRTAYSYFMMLRKIL